MSKKKTPIETIEEEARKLDRAIDTILDYIGIDSEVFSGNDIPNLAQKLHDLEKKIEKVAEPTDNIEQALNKLTKHYCHGCAWLKEDADGFIHCDVPFGDVKITRDENCEGFVPKEDTTKMPE